MTETEPIVDDGGIELVTVTVTCPLPGAVDHDGEVVVPEGGCLNGGITLQLSAAVGGSVVCGPCGTVLIEIVEGPSAD